jgi:stress-induced morphogen
MARVLRVRHKQQAGVDPIMIEAHEIETLIKRSLSDATLTVIDLTGTQDHYKVVVVSTAFSGKRPVARHQLINQILSEPLKGPLHALSIETHTPEEWQKKQSEAPQTISFTGGVHGRY